MTWSGGTVQSTRFACLSKLPSTRPIRVQTGETNETSDQDHRKDRSFRQGQPQTTGKAFQDEQPQTSGQSQRNLSGTVGRRAVTLSVARLSIGSGFDARLSALKKRSAAYSAR